jgi:hypothetical protein
VSPPRWSAVGFVVGAALALSACGGGAAPKASGTTNGSVSTTPGSPPPQAAKSVATQLASPSESVSHAALAPAAASLVSPGALFPAGTTVELNPNTWHQYGRSANATATVTTKRTTRSYEIGFLDTPSGWRVTFDTPLQ